MAQHPMALSRPAFRSDECSGPGDLAGECTRKKESNYGKCGCQAVAVG